MRKSLLILIVLVYCVGLCCEAKAFSSCLSLPSVAFWIWTPKTKKLVNPKYAAKDTPEEQFKWAIKFFNDKEYKRAAEEFARLTSSFKDSDLAPEAQYYCGLSYQKDGRPYPAFEAYQKVVEIYPFTKRIDEIIEREYAIGNELYKKHRAKLMGIEIMTDLDRAAEIFATVRDNAPFGEYSDQAQFMIGLCYKKSELYSEAMDAFQKLVDDYPHSKLQDKAKYEIAQVTYLASRNSDYDQELTDEAIKEFKGIAKNEENTSFSKEAKEAIFMLEEKKTKSLFKTAKFYEKHKHYKGAVVYYKEILKKYPNSSLGELAGEKIKFIEEFKIK